MPGYDYSDVTYRSADGRLNLYSRDYGGDGMAVLCLHGLTRNSADFHDLAMRFKPRYRILAADQRGRGRSPWDPDPANYQPAVYVQDVLRLLDHLELERAAVIGTSMGGLMAMILGVTARPRLIGAVLNDIGPELDPAGLARIASYAGKSTPVATWAEAAEQTRLINETAFPDFGPADWLAFARRLYIEGDGGKPMLAYDPAIAKGLAPSGGVAATPDLWPMWDGLEGLPLLVIRGGLSDLLSVATLAKMAARHAWLTTTTIANRGHAPMLTEPEALDAIGGFLASLRVSA